MLKDGIGFSRVIVCCGRVDLRKGIPGLTAYVRLNYGLSTTEKGTLFFFCGNRSDRIKGIVFEGDEGDGKIVDSVRAQSPDVLQFAKVKGPLLSWTHYRNLLQVADPDARTWYEKEAYEQGWSVRTLQRNIQSQYYNRMLLSHHNPAVKDEMHRLTSDYQGKLEFIRNPVIAEFLGMQEDTSYLETDLEQAIISNLQRFLMELGKGYAFVARQQRIHTEKQDYYIDLVFYNYILQCFVLIDLKIGKITHQDVGQMDMYVRMYDELKKSEQHNPTLGIVLCSETLLATSGTT